MLKKKKNFRLPNNISSFRLLSLSLIAMNKKQDLKIFFKDQTLLLII